MVKIEKNPSFFHAESFCCTSTEAATQKVAHSLRESRTQGVAFFDVDDTLVDTQGAMLEAFNQSVLALNSSFQPLELIEIIAAGGHIWDVPRVHISLSQFQVSFREMWHQISTDQQLRETLPIRHHAQHFQQILLHQRIPTLGYVTARIESQALATAKNLFHHGFTAAPIVCTKSERSPTDEKEEFFESILPSLKKDQIIYYIDDRVETVLKLHDKYHQKFRFFVPYTQRREKELNSLPKDIVHGDLRQLCLSLLFSSR